MVKPRCFFGHPEKAVIPLRLKTALGIVQEHHRVPVGCVANFLTAASTKV